MPRKRSYSNEQIITKLREADVLLSQGKSAEEIARVLEISKQTYYRWRKVQECQTDNNKENPAKLAPGADIGRMLFRLIQSDQAARAKSGTVIKNNQ